MRERVCAEMATSMKLAMMLPARRGIQWNYAAQLGVKYAITKAASDLSGKKDPSDLDALYQIKKEFQEEGLTLYGLEGDQFDMGRIKLGLPGWEEDISRYKKMLENMGKLEIPLLCYNFMAGVGWFRTDYEIPERGGALATGFDAGKVEKKPVIITKEQMWENYSRFIAEVIPTAEKWGVRMALHPDDPPIDCLLGYSRIMTSGEAYRKALSLSDSPSHGITFCQSCFRLAGEDVYELIKEFGSRIAFLHIRDVDGVKEKFRETFHDNGPTDMAKLMKLANQYAPGCVVRPDHTPTMAGEDNGNAGYAVLGNHFAVGYIRGLADGQNILLE